MRLAFTLCRLVFNLLLGAVEAVCWVAYATKRTIRIVEDGLNARALLSGAELRCPRGHTISADGRYRCGLCGFCYAGEDAAWMCANPACGAVTPYLSCPTCGLSTPNPFRLG